MSYRYGEPGDQSFAPGIVTVNSERVPLALYKKANREASGNKDSALADIKNIHDIDISEFSDQIIGKNSKIQGIYVSCGLHVHFSCEEVDEVDLLPEGNGIDQDGLL